MNDLLQDSDSFINVRDLTSLKFTAYAKNRTGTK